MAHMDYSGEYPKLVDEWHIEDVQERHPWVTDAQAVKVLEVMAKHRDAVVGISYEIIDVWVDHLFPEPRVLDIKEHALVNAGFSIDYREGAWEIHDPSDLEGYRLRLESREDLLEEAYLNIFSGESHVESI